MLVRPLPLQLYHPARHPKHPGFPHGHGPRPEAYGQPKGLLVQQGKIYGNTAPTKLLGICVGERTVSTRPTHGSPTSASVKDGCAPGMLSQPRAVASNPHAAVVSFKMCFSLCSLGHLGSSHERHELCPPPLPYVRSLRPKLPAKYGLRYERWIYSKTTRQDGTHCKLHSHAPLRLSKRVLAAEQLPTEGVPLAYPQR